MPRVEHYATKYKIPLWLANALIGQESGGRAGAVSPKGATGLTQVLPSTAAGMYGISAAEASRRLKNPEFALDAGFRYLSTQIKDFGGNLRLALAAYNAGPNAVREYGGIPPYKETQDYVRNIMAKGRGAKTPPAPPGAPQSLTQPQVSVDPLEGLRSLAAGEYDPQAMLDAIKQAREAMPTGDETPALEPQLTGDRQTSMGLKGNVADWVRVPQRRGQWQGPGKQVLGFVAGMGQTIGAPLEVWDTSTHSRMTTSGRVSAHTSGRAVDIPATGQRLRQLGYIALVQAGMDPKQAQKAAAKGGLFNIGGYQIIFATRVGGNHYDHVHVGVRG